MTTLTVEIDKEKDLPAVEAFLTKMGLKFEVDDDDDDWGDLPEDAIEGIKAGLEDFAAGRVHTHEFVMEQINKKINR